MAKGLGIFILGVIVGTILFYIITNISSFSVLKGGLNQLGDTPQNATTSQLDTCLFQVRNAMSIFSAKASSTTSISIVNSTIFGRADIGAVQNKTTAWETAWESGLNQGFGCDSNVKGDYGYLCSDMQQAESISANVSGVAVKVQLSRQGTQIAFDIPLLCSNGNLTANSANFIESGAGGVLLT